MGAVLALLLLLIPQAIEKPIMIGQTINARLEKSDAIASDRWDYRGRAGQTITIEMSSDEFDSVLRLYSTDGRLLLSDDNGGTGLNARMVMRLPTDGRYRIEVATVWSQRGGGYRLTVAEGETPTLTGSNKFAADIEYFDRCLRATQDNSWKSELHAGRLLAALGLGRDSEAFDAAETAVKLAKEQGDKYAAAKACFSIATGFARLGDYNRALPYFEQTLAFQQELKDSFGEALTLVALADAHQFLDNADKARALYSKALELRRELKDRRGEGFALFGTAESYRLVKQPKQAIPFYEQALAASREVGNRSGESYTLFGLADCYRSLDDYARALPLYEQALAASRDTKDRALEGVVLAAIADGYRYVGDCPRAVPAYEQTLVVRRELKDQRGEAYTLNGLAQCERATGQLQRAADHYAQMLAICKQNDDRRGQLLALQGLAPLLRTLTQYDKAAAVFEQLLTITRELKDRRGEFNALIGLGNAYTALAQPERALPYLEQALAMNAENSEKRGGEALYTALANAALASKRYDKASDYLEKLLADKRAEKDIAGEAVLLLMLATAERLRERNDIALETYRRALPLFVESRDAAGEYAVLYGMAETARRKKDWQGAQSNYEAALKIIETNPTLTAREDQLGMIAPLLVYDSYVDMLASQGQFARALTVAERLRVHNYRVALRAVAPKEEESRLVPLTAEEIQALAERLGVTFVEYLPTRQGLAIWVVKAGATAGFYSPTKPERLEQLLDRKRAELEAKSARLDALREALGAPARNDSAEEENGLYALLFPAEIGGVIENDSRVVVVAPGKLATVPFAELRDEQGNYLIDRVAVSYAPSVSALAAALRSRTADQISVGNLVLASPTPGAYQGRALPVLEGVKEELRNLSGTLKTKPVLGALATIAALREQGTRREVIHIASYAFANDSQPMASFIALSPETNEQGETISSGILTAAQLRALPLNADLFVVTALQAGFHPTNGEGLAAFAHSLALAGCANGLVTLWNVEAKVVEFFVKEFYDSLKKGADAPASHRKAIAKTRQKFKSPAQWAAFILIGSPHK